MVAPQVETQAGPCEPWTTEALIRAQAPFDDETKFPDPLVQQMADAASDIAWQLGGRRWPGSCSDTVMPGSCGTVRGLVTPWPWRDGVTIVSLPPVQRFGFGMCCAGHGWIDLGSYPIQSVDEVRIDGVALDPDLYLVLDWKWLVKADRGWWPCCNNPSDTTPRIEVDFTFGEDPPESGVVAATRIARELCLLNADRDACALPQRVQSIIRENVTIETAQRGLVDALRDGHSGIPEVDLFMWAHNPAGLRRRGRIIDPLKLVGGPHRRTS